MVAANTADPDGCHGSKGSVRSTTTTPTNCGDFCPKKKETASAFCPPFIFPSVRSIGGMLLTLHHVKLRRNEFFGGAVDLKLSVLADSRFGK